MRSLKRMISSVTVFMLALSLAVPVFAAVEDTGFADVDAGAWYADAAVYCRDNGLMSGTGDITFSPDGAMTRSMLATVLYRQAGSPAVTGSDDFTDTADGAWYADAVLWASQEGIVSGYGNGLFGGGDPVTREQIATILWRYSGSPAAGEGTPFADESDISSWAVSAVAWSCANGYVNGVDGGRFAPADTATRAQVAAVLMRYDQGSQTTLPEPSPEPDGNSDVLIAYFSCTGNTEAVANRLNAILDADLYEIVPEIPYTDADLNYGDSGSRTSVEMNDPDARPAISGSVENMEDYEVIFLGYPIWWGDAPRIISTFLESYDFDGRTIVPFCTSGSSGIGSSADDLQDLTNGASWLEGRRFSGGASQESIADWVDSLGLELSTAA